MKSLRRTHAETWDSKHNSEIHLKIDKRTSFEGVYFSSSPVVDAVVVFYILFDFIFFSVSNSVIIAYEFNSDYDCYDYMSNIH